MGSLWPKADAPPATVGPRGRLAHSNQLGTVHIMPPRGAPRAAFPAPVRPGIRARSGNSFLSLGFPPRRRRPRGLRGAPPTAPQPCWQSAVAAPLRGPPRGSRAPLTNAGKKSARENYPPDTYRGTWLIRNRHPVGPYSRTMPGLLWWSWGGGAVSYDRGTPAGFRV